MDNTENTFSVSRAHLIYGLTLPLAALLGFLLAEPFGSNVVLVGCLAAALALPLLMRWYHLLLVMTWNAVLIVPFLPGQPPWWMVFTALGFVVVILNRCVGGPSVVERGAEPVTKAVLMLALVVGGTAMLTGGAGLRSLGGESYGGRRYAYIAAAVMGYFILISRRIPPGRAGLLASLFFLSGATSVLSDMASLYWPGLGYIVPSYGQVLESIHSPGLVRHGGVVGLANAFCLLLMLRHGARGLLDYSRPWRMLLFLACLLFGMLSGFRSHFILICLTSFFLFLSEGLHRTRHVMAVFILLVVGAVGLICVSDRLPTTVQRSLSFLPIEISPVAQADAKDSVDWRVEMWLLLMPQAREHFWLGKGYLLSPDELYMASVDAHAGFEARSATSSVAGDYHNGPLSVLIPFGIWGLLALCYLFFRSIRLMRHYCTSGSPEVRAINNLLLACFVTRVIFFFFFFGSLFSDLPYMLGLVGLAISLNGRPSSGPGLAANSPTEEGGSETT